jgi:hypothetical protein
MEMIELTEAKLSDLTERLERAETDEELDAIATELGATEGRDAECWLVPTLADVAEFFAVHESTVKGWRSQRMPGEPGLWNLQSIVRWRLAKAEQRGLSVDDESERSLLREKTRIDIERKRLELDEKQGRLVYRSAVESVLREGFSLTRARLQALPGEIASAVPADVRSVVLEESDVKVRLALKDLAKLSERAEAGRDE